MGDLYGLDVNLLTGIGCSRCDSCLIHCINVDEYMAVILSSVPLFWKKYSLKLELVFINGSKYAVSMKGHSL